MKPVVSWAGENMTLSGLSGVRWIVEDALRFVRREVRRGRRYRGILLDPPAYGRGANGEKWVLEDNLCEMLGMLRAAARTRGLLPRALNLLLHGALPRRWPARRPCTRLSARLAGEQWGGALLEDRAGKTAAASTYYRMMR